jgi:hypothetical protein
MASPEAKFVEQILSHLRLRLIQNSDLSIHLRLIS